MTCKYYKLMERVALFKKISKLKLLNIINCLVL